MIEFPQKKHEYMYGAFPRVKIFTLSSYIHYSNVIQLFVNI